MVTDKNSQIALFRYGIISDFINRTQLLKYGEKEKLLRSKYNCTWQIPHSKKQVSLAVLLFIGLNAIRNLEEKLNRFILSAEVI
jgi:hypothetical protein